MPKPLRSIAIPHTWKSAAYTPATRRPGALGQAIHTAATNAFLHGLSIGCLVAGGVAAAGAILAALFLPAQPASPPVVRTTEAVPTMTPVRD